MMERTPVFAIAGNLRRPNAYIVHTAAKIAINPSVKAAANPPATLEKNLLSAKTARAEAAKTNRAPIRRAEFLNSKAGKSNFCPSLAASRA
jgi:hypothetical protein